MGNARLWIQNHLSSVAVLLIAAVVVVSANLNPVAGDISEPESEYDDKTDIYVYQKYGWPSVAVRQVSRITRGARPSQLVTTPPALRLSKFGLSIDIFAALAILLAVWFVWQWLRRSRFQMHLSTAVVLMFVAGGMIWENVNWTQTRGYGERRIAGAEDRCMGYSEDVYGWPRHAIVFAHGESSPGLISFWGIATDLAVALAILLSIWFVCEWRIRWLAARTAPKSA